MAYETEVQVTTKAHADGMLPTKNTVIGTTADSGVTDATLQGSLKRSQYISLAAASTTILSTASYIERITVNPATTAAGGFVLSDGTTAILTVSSLGHQLTPQPYTIHLGIRSVSTSGFRIVTGASVSAIVVGAWGTPTTA
jgi:hypothetical protein